MTDHNTVNVGIDSWSYLLVAEDIIKLKTLSKMFHWHMPV